jgi:hypothetical protein
MRLVKVKTARFADLVREAGKPEPYIPWQDPAHDPAFRKALRENRVLTVHQETTGNRSDYGMVGYMKENRGNLLIFPKKLDAWEDRRVIGIKYDAISPPGRSEPAKAERKSARPSRRTEPDRSEKLRAAFAVVRSDEPKEPAKVEADREEERPDDLAAEVKRLRRGIDRARAALEKDKPVEAYKILKEFRD